MRFHVEWSKALHAMLPFHRGAGTLPQNTGMADDSPMITALFEAHQSLESMLAALAELREDEAGHPLR